MNAKPIICYNCGHVIPLRPIIWNIRRAGETLWQAISLHPKCAKWLEGKW